MRTALLLIACGAAAGKPTYPAAPREPVTDTYFGTKVADPYRWLEDAKDPRVVAWTAAENALTRKHLDAIPERDKIHARVTAIMGKRPPSYFDVAVRGDLVFAKSDQPPKQQNLIVVTDRLDSTGRVVLDPNVLDPSGGTAIDFYVPSRDGKKLAVSLSKGGSESGDVHVYDVATGQELDVIPNVNSGTAGGSVAWNADGTGLWFTRIDGHQQVYFHAINGADTYVLGKDFPDIAEVQLATDDDGKQLLITVELGDGGQYALYTGDGTQLAAFADDVVHGEFGADGNIYALARKGAPMGQIVRYDHGWSVVVPASDGVITQFAVTRTRVWVAEVVGGPSRLRAVHLDDPGRTDDIAIDVPFGVPAIAGLVRLGDDLLYQAASYTNALTVFRAHGTTSTPTAFAMAMPYAMDDVEVVRDTCTSKDGTEVPISILRKKGVVLDGSHPALLTGYGGYGASRVPGMRAIHRLWLDEGGVFADANLRGGREKGEAWHEAGRLTHKQNVFDDFYACAQRLVERGYTRPERLAIIGGSNGGLLMGAQITQHPAMVRAVVAQVGIYDSLRFELTPNGAFNVTELGTVKDEAQFRAMLAYSPYHHVEDGVAYPAVLFTTGANDPRVDPYNSRKMTARLQAATSSDRPILLRASSDVGHGIGTPLQTAIDELTDIDAFLAEQLSMHL